MARPNRGLKLFLTTAALMLSASTSRAQDPELLRHFDYDQTTPLNIKRIGVAHREYADVYDITYDSLKGGVVPAYLVVPKGRGAFAAVIWGHWYWANSSMANRKEFLEEAVVLAQAGVVSLLTDGPLATNDGRLISFSKLWTCVAALMCCWRAGTSTASESLM